MTDSVPSIQHRVETDRYENPVSLITLAGGRVLRMVHHTPAGRPRQRATVYAGRGVYVKVASYFPDNPCAVETAEVAGYRISWGDGDVLATECPAGAPDLSESMRRTQGDEDLLLLVLTAIVDRPELWLRKEAVAA